ncbi:hypothetical protein CDL15_Pgr029151 [Punica granatum]|uniref:Uncharacterized protein n=1 Tax=Punica granatum TaxID=22663 RepID=A0A218XLS9_PUNGR|nr:hypothetical protein CDL15_Pgr029151 [Punica granatum]
MLQKSRYDGYNVQGSRYKNSKARVECKFEPTFLDSRYKNSNAQGAVHMFDFGSSSRARGVEYKTEHLLRESRNGSSKIWRVKHKYDHMHRGVKDMKHNTVLHGSSSRGDGVDSKFKLTYKEMIHGSNRPRRVDSPC